MLTWRLHIHPKKLEIPILIIKKEQIWIIDFT
jgi:hypothetical protein